MTQDQLPSLRSVGYGLRGHDPKLAEDQFKQGYGQGLWIFFKIKVKQSERVQEERVNIWACFCAPAENFRSCEGGRFRPCTLRMKIDQEHFDYHRDKVKVRGISVFRMLVRMLAGEFGCMD